MALLHENLGTFDNIALHIKRNSNFLFSIVEKGPLNEDQNQEAIYTLCKSVAFLSQIVKYFPKNSLGDSFMGNLFSVTKRFF